MKGRNYLEESFTLGEAYFRAPCFHGTEEQLELSDAYHGAEKVMLEFVSREVVCRHYNEELYIHNFLCPILLFVFEGFVPDNKEVFRDRGVFCYS